MPVSINGTTGVTAPEVTLDNATADGGQVVLSSSGFSNWNLDNFSGRLRAYYGSTEYLTLTNAGNLGVGTTSPATKFNVADTSTNCTITVTNSASNFQVQSNNNDGYFNLNGSGNIIFRSGTPSVTERARIDSSGNLLVNRTANTSTTSQVALSYNANAGIRGLGIQATVQDIGTAVQFINASGTVCGTISQGTSSVAYNTSSDYRLKKDVQPMTGALDRVAALKPVTYKWNVDGSDGEGFIAHELAQVCPDAVTGEKDAVDEDGNPQYQGIDTSFLVATLTAAIQELKAIVDQQATEIANLKGQA